MTLIGREEETKELKRIYESGLPEFVAVYGRRRVGKTFLVKEFFNYDFTFYTSGLARGSKSDQLGSFYSSLLQYGLKESCTKPGDWFAAFEALKTVIEQSDKQRKVIFIDDCVDGEIGLDIRLAAYSNYLVQVLRGEVCRRV